jgi:hypothetical protein
MVASFRLVSLIVCSGIDYTTPKSILQEIFLQWQFWVIFWVIWAVFGSSCGVKMTICSRLIYKDFSGCWA